MNMIDKLWNGFVSKGRNVSPIGDIGTFIRDFSGK